MTDQKYQGQPLRNSGVGSSEIVIQPGLRVLVTGDHPWSGNTGTVKEKIKTLVGELWVVTLDNGGNAGATEADIKAV